MALNLNPITDHHIWLNKNPNEFNSSTGNRFESQNPVAGKLTALHTFTQYSKISLGNWEGNVSNDAHYAVMRCSNSTTNLFVVYDIKNDSIVASMNIDSELPNNVTRSQSGKYVAAEWSSGGSGPQQGITIHNRNDLSLVEQGSECGGCHYDLGYNTKGNEVIVMQSWPFPEAIVDVRFDNGATAVLLTGAQMSWNVHILCRNLNRPGWIYLTEFDTNYSEPSKPNYQKIFCVKIDGSGTVNSFAHVHHNTNGIENYDHSPFGVPNRDGCRAMFDSDWGNLAGKVDSYVATMLPDSMTPSFLTGLVSSVPTLNNFTLSWHASKYKVVITSYEVFKDSISIGTTTDTFKFASGLNASVAYSMTVKSKDEFGNALASSSPLIVKTISATKVISSSSPDEKLKVTVSPNAIVDHSIISIMSEIDEDFTVSITYRAGRIVYDKQFLKTNQEILNTFENKTMFP